MVATPLADAVYLNLEASELVVRVAEPINDVVEPVSAPLAFKPLAGLEKPDQMVPHLGVAKPLAKMVELDLVMEDTPADFVDLSLLVNGLILFLVKRLA